MKDKRNKGITLIALVVTIIVLLILAGISISMISGQNGILTKAGDAGDSTKYSNYKERVDLFFQSKRIEKETEENEYEETITDKAEIKKIIQDITDEDLEKVLIQKGKLVYDPEKVNDNEKTLMESVGILAMAVGATIIFIANGQEFARTKSSTIIFPDNNPTKEHGVFYGWYYDEEGVYPYNNAPINYQSVNYETGEPTYNYSDWDMHEQNKANEGDEIEGTEIILYATFRGTNNFSTCLVEGTKITLADGTKKKIEDITYNDKILVWNFDDGKIDSSEPIWIMKKTVSNKYLQFKFDNEALLKLTVHRVFNVDNQIFANADMDEEIDIGTRVFLEDGTTAKVIGKEEVEEEVNVYNVMTKQHINLFAEGILTSLRFNDIYEIKDMKFIKDNRELNKKEDYPNIPENYFEGLRLAEQKNTLVESGKPWWEERVENVIMKNAE